MTVARSLTCRELIEFLMDYVEETLPPEERAAFDAHLAICPDCVRYLDGYRTTVRAGRAAFSEPDAPVPDEVPAALVSAILRTRRGD